MKFLLRLFGSFFTLLILAAIGAVVALGLYHSSGSPEQSRVVNITRGANLNGILDQLYNEGVICTDSILHTYPLCKAAFFSGVILSGNKGKLKAGEYEIPPYASMAEIVRLLASGKVVAHNLTFPEGLTVKQIAAIIEAEKSLTGAVGELPKEGTLLPETYQFIKGEERSSIIARMKKAHEEVMSDLWQKRAPDLPLTTPEEAVTLASIVERETAIPAERARVAGVYVNRLKKGMLLQSDPTTIYGLSDGLGDINRPLTFTDLKSVSPYNTYVITGLPPGPIANPGRASLEAALHPETHDFLYFVADGTGGHAFGKNLTEHNKNVANWRKVEREQR